MTVPIRILSPMLLMKISFMMVSTMRKTQRLNISHDSGCKTMIKLNRKTNKWNKKRRQRNSKETKRLISSLRSMEISKKSLRPKSLKHPLSRPT